METVETPSLLTTLVVGLLSVALVLGLARAGHRLIIRKTVLGQKAEKTKAVYSEKTSHLKEQ